MAKKTRSRAKAGGPKPATAKPKRDKDVEVISLPPEQPAFWFGFDVAWLKLLVFRVVFFGMLAIDALLQIRHAPRYGAGGFNVAQLPFLDSIGPTRGSYEVAQLISAY